MKEIWKPTKAGYEISNYGRLKSMFRIVNSGNGARRPIRERIIKLTSSPNGYPIHKNTSIHKLVAMAFIPNPENKPQVNHKNGIKKDNRVENLEWVTAQENGRHARDTGLITYKLNSVQVIKIRSLYKDGMSQEMIAKKFNVATSTIYVIVTGRRWTHLLDSPLTSQG